MVKFRHTHIFMWINVHPATILPHIPQMVEVYGPLLYYIGLADENQLEYINNETAQGVQYIKAGKYYEAFEVCVRILYRIPSLES